MGNVEFFLFFVIPLLSGYVKEFHEIQKNFKVKIIKGYTWVILIPLLFLYLGFLGLQQVSQEIFGDAVILKWIIVIGVSTAARALSMKLLNYRQDKMNLKIFSEEWLMNRFYRDLAYALLVMLPGIAGYLVM